MRTFLTTPEVNGDAPRYGYGCGFECPPGPGYWPIDAPEHPSAMGWRNPTHVIAGRAFAGAPARRCRSHRRRPARATSTALWSLPSDRADAEQVGDLPLNAGDRYRLLLDRDRAAKPRAPRAPRATGSGTASRCPTARSAWVQAAIPSANDTGSDGRPSSVRFDFLPAIAAAE